MGRGSNHYQGFESGGFDTWVCDERETYRSAEIERGDKPQAELEERAHVLASYTTAELESELARRKK
jgi:hypothetical protein